MGCLARRNLSKLLILPRVELIPPTFTGLSLTYISNSYHEVCTSRHVTPHYYNSLLMFSNSTCIFLTLHLRTLGSFKGRHIATICM